MKKLLPIFIVLSLLLLFSACSDKKKAQEETTGTGLEDLLPDLGLPYGYETPVIFR